VAGMPRRKHTYNFKWIYKRWLLFLKDLTARDPEKTKTFPRMKKFIGRAAGTRSMSIPIATRQNFQARTKKVVVFY
jgi:hypothetical protein